MKKYLFDEIIVDSNGNIIFKSFRDISFIEIFSTCKCGHCETDKSYANRDRWLFEPKTIKQFLNCLEMTKTDGGEYLIDAEYPYEDLTIDDVLRMFAKGIYESKRVSLPQLNRFYEKAKAIQEEVKADRQILKYKPSELIK